MSEWMRVKWIKLHEWANECRWYYKPQLGFVRINWWNTPRMQARSGVDKQPSALLLYYTTWSVPSACMDSTKKYDWLIINCFIYLLAQNRRIWQQKQHKPTYIYKTHYRIVQYWRVRWGKGIGPTIKESEFDFRNAGHVQKFWANCDRYV